MEGACTRLICRVNVTWSVSRASSAVASVFLCVTGYLVFKRLERTFADKI